LPRLSAKARVRAIVSCEVGARAGLRPQPVGFPGHFLVKHEDAGGRVVVDPFNAGRVLDEIDLQRLLERDYRYVEDRIYEHEQIYALGGFRSVTGADADDASAAAASLLVEWKQDQPALLQRFDSDRNGRISVDEWEKARAAARECC
jgi:hypothetical protein